MDTTRVDAKSYTMNGQRTKRKKNSILLMTRESDTKQCIIRKLILNSCKFLSKSKSLLLLTLVYTIGILFNWMLDQKTSWKYQKSQKRKRHEINLANALGIAGRIWDKKKEKDCVSSTFLLWHEWTLLKAFNFIFSFPSSRYYKMFLSINNFEPIFGHWKFQFQLKIRKFQK